MIVRMTTAPIVDLRPISDMTSFDLNDRFEWRAGGTTLVARVACVRDLMLVDAESRLVASVLKPSV